jgi:glycosyltransferase involved in cell wall biosynthesis
MDVSVIIPLFNVEKYVGLCVDALLGQDYPENRYEIIGVENNSTDRTAELVAGYPRVRLIKEPKTGAYAARNSGISAAKGEILAFTDGDCVPQRDWISCIAVAMRESGREILLGKRDCATFSSSLRLLSDYDSTLAAHLFSSDMKESYFGYTNNMAVRASLFEKQGKFLEIARGADTIFVHKTVEAYGPSVVHFEPVMRVRHLELVSTIQFYKKRLIYGKSNEANRVFGSAEPLSQTERLRVFRKTICEHRYSLLTSVHLFILLAVGVVFYEYGRLLSGRMGNSPL